MVFGIAFTLASVAILVGTTKKFYPPIDEYDNENSPSYVGAPHEKTRTQAAADSTLNFDPFGTVEVIENGSQPKELVIFFSGDGGWAARERGMAGALAHFNVITVGVDVVAYRNNLKLRDPGCHSIVADILKLADTVKQKFNLNSAIVPTLIGYSSGATWVYAALTQAEPETFRGGISFSFCKDLEVDRPLCGIKNYSQGTLQVDANYEVFPAIHVQHSWFVLHGEADQVCKFSEAKNFTSGIQSGTTLINLPGVGHGFKNSNDWVSQLTAAATKLWSETR